MLTNKLSYKQCEHHASQMIERIRDKLHTKVDVLINEDGGATVTVYDETKQGAIVEMLLNFWALKQLSRHSHEPILMFFELQEKTK